MHLCEYFCEAMFTTSIANTVKTFGTISINGRYTQIIVLVDFIQNNQVNNKLVITQKGPVLQLTCQPLVSVDRCSSTSWDYGRRFRLHLSRPTPSQLKGDILRHQVWVWSAIASRFTIAMWLPSRGHHKWECPPRCMLSRSVGSCGWWARVNSSQLYSYIPTVTVLKGFTGHMVMTPPNLGSSASLFEWRIQDGHLEAILRPWGQNRQPYSVV